MLFLKKDTLQIIAVMGRTELVFLILVTVCFIKKNELYKRTYTAK